MPSLNELVFAKDYRWGVSVTRCRERVPDEANTELQRAVGDVGHTREGRS